MAQNNQRGLLVDLSQYRGQKASSNIWDSQSLPATSATNPLSQPDASLAQSMAPEGGVEKPIIHSHVFTTDRSPQLTASLEPAMSDNPTKDEMKAEIGRSAAEIETKMVRIEGELKTALATIAGKIDSLSTSVTDGRKDTKDSRNVIIGTVIAVGGLLLGVAVYTDSIFSRGMQVRDVVKSVVEEMKTPVPPKQP